MKERPILFSAPMVRALLAGTKTQTRRVVKPQPVRNERGVLMWGVSKHREIGFQGKDIHPDLHEHCPYGAPGDKLWVRETWQAFERGWDVYKGIPKSRPGNCCTLYAADDVDGDLGWRPSIHMPRWASRITLEITGVRVERLNDISDADAQAEGTPCYVCGGALDGRSEADCHCFHRTAKLSDFCGLWESINGEGSWTTNPWVWVVEFKRIGA